MKTQSVFLPIRISQELKEAIIAHAKEMKIRPSEWARLALANAARRQELSIQDESTTSPKGIRNA